MQTVLDSRRNRFMGRSLAIATILVIRCQSFPLLAGEPPPAPSPSEAEVFFESRVRPLLWNRCVKCHGADKQSSSLRVDSREALIAGGDSGPAIVPGKWGESLLIQAVAGTHADIKMPPKEHLADQDIQALKRWVEIGAPWVSNVKGAGPARTASHWSFQPLRATTPPPVRDVSWPRTPIDTFILAKLESAGIAPSPPIDKRGLIRRATIDLWGIPPTADETDRFLADHSPLAYERLIDRLLASPRYGERWGRHWLDVARYADTKGYVFTQDRRYPFAHTYRDYVIWAFNHDTPFSQMIIDQLAADRASASNSPALAAMGFLTVGRRFLQDQNEIIDDRIDVVSRGLLGLTVTCARCHDHKFDPIPAEDYYSLYGVFASSNEPADLPMIQGPGASESATKDYDRRHAEAAKGRERYLAQRRDEITADFRARLSVYLRVAAAIDFTPRRGETDKKARESGLDVRRLRGLSLIWKQRTSAPEAASSPILAPWKAFAALKPDEFKAKAPEIAKALVAPGRPAPHPLIKERLLTSPPTRFGEVVDRYVALLAELESRTAAARKAGVAKLPPEWDSLANSLLGDKGPLALTDEETKTWLNQEQRGRLERYNGALVALDATHPGAPSRAMVLVDAPNAVEPHVFIRGNPGRPGKQIPRRFLKVLSGPERPPFKGSGRLELAQAIADPKNPLTARVFVNRAWMWHFGKGLVGTPSDFGLRGDPPTHPELLDYLAAEFTKSGWSIKTLHRLIMLSSVYQQSSEPRSAEIERDAENRLLWRFNRQRLDFESMRDAILAASGALDEQIGGLPAKILEPPYSNRRTLYGFIDRQNLDGVYRAFDFAVPDATSPKRFVTTVPQQALFLMNGPFVLEQARRMASMVDPKGTSAQGVGLLYRRALGRPPQPDELELACRFIDGIKADPAGSPWERLAQVLILTNEFMFVD